MFVSRNRKKVIMSDEERRRGESFDPELFLRIKACGGPAVLNGAGLCSLLYGDFDNGEIAEKKLKTLMFISNIRNKEKFYREAQIEKKGGGERVLAVPTGRLKDFQKRFLEKCLNGRHASRYSYAYEKGRSVKDNALVHVGAKLVYKLDIKNFFGSVSFDEVCRIIFPSDGDGQVYPSALIRLCARLCTYKGVLPQGAPTSPKLANLVMEDFDEEIGEYCRTVGINYTRYCDDLTFSAAASFDLKRLSLKVSEALGKKGMRLNRSKTALAGSGERQSVTGIVVNGGLSAKKEYKNKLRQELYFLYKYGVRRHVEALKAKGEYKSAGSKQEEELNYLQSLLGRVNFCVNLNPLRPRFLNDRDTLKEYISRARTEVENNRAESNTQTRLI